MKKSVINILLSATICFSSLCFADKTHQSINKSIESLSKEIIKTKRAFKEKHPDSEYDKKIWVQEKLSEMVTLDESARTFWAQEGEKYPDKATKEYFVKQFLVELAKVDKSNTEDLKKILQHTQWVDISKYGDKADHDAWLIVQHADHDLAFQEHVLSILKAKVKSKETDLNSYAYLYDRVMTNKGEKQLYGTQAACELDKKGKIHAKPKPIDDMKHLSERRKQYHINPANYDEYLAMLNKYCKKIAV